MPRSTNIRKLGLDKHIDAWAVEHDTPTYERFDHYMRHGDEFGDPLPISKYMKLWKTSKNTILKWQMIWQEGNK